jgi:hypothetical protein
LGDPAWFASRHGLVVEKDFDREVVNAFGRERDARGDRERPAYRNGYRTGEINTAEVPRKYSAPQVREATERFVSSVWSGALRGQAGADNKLRDWKSQLN